MDKEVYRIKADEIKALINMGAYYEAMEIADEIDWRRVRGVAMLCIVSDLYKKVRRYEDSKNILMMAYEKNPGSRTIVYSLCELSIKTGDLVNALEYCKEYAQLAPGDIGKHILTYKIYKAQGVSLEEQIAILEELKSLEYREKWAYELAYLYHRVGLATKCIEECDEIFLWFGEGKYVIQALELKMLHCPLTEKQQEVYDHRFDDRNKEEEEEVLQAPESFTEESGEAAKDGEEPVDILNAPTTRIPTEEIEIQIQMMGGEAPYDTINLQQEVAEGIKDYLEKNQQSDIDKYRFGVEDDLPEGDFIQEDLPKSMENALSMDYDGQMSLVVPEQNTVEKQITGQLSIQDILTEWERMKQESTKRGEDNVRQMVLQQTGPLFSEFDAAIKDGLLEKLEKGEEIEGMVDPKTVMEEENEIPLDSEGYESIEGVEEDVVFELAEEEAEEEAEADAEETFEEDLMEETEETSEEDVEEETEEAPWEDVEEEAKETSEEDVEEEAEETTEVDVEEEAEETSEDDVEEETEETSEEEVEEVEEETEEASEDDVEEETEEAYEEDSQSDIEWELGATEEDSEEDDNCMEAEEAAQEDNGQDKENYRNITPEEKELFSGFIDHPRTQKMLVKALDSISLASYTGNVLIAGEDAKNCLKLCKCMIKYVQMGDPNFSGKVAKVSGGALNNRDIKETFESLAGGALIIQKASELTKETVDCIYKTIQQEKYGLLLLAYDGRSAMHQFAKEYPKLANCFNSRMEIRSLGDRDLAKYGISYARSQEYSIDEMGILELHTCIAARQTSDHAVTKAEVREIVDDAIRRVNKISLGHFFDIILAKRYDEEDMIILRDKDFKDGK